MVIAKAARKLAVDRSVEELGIWGARTGKESEMCATDFQYTKNANTNATIPLFDTLEQFRASGLYLLKSGMVDKH